MRSGRRKPKCLLRTRFCAWALCTRASQANRSIRDRQKGSRPMATVVSGGVGVTHPLEPLSAEEIAAAAEIVRTQRQLGPRVRFVTITLQEPPKQEVLRFDGSTPLDRQAFITLLDNTSGTTCEAVVSLTQDSVVDWREIQNVQPAIMLDEFLECEQACKAESSLAGGNASAWHHRLRPVHGRPVVGRKLRRRHRDRPPPVACADLGPHLSRRQRLRPARRERHRRGGPAGDGGARRRGLRGGAAAARGRQLLSPPSPAAAPT